MEQEQKPLNIFQRINEVRKEVAYIKKDKKVEGYQAITHDMVTAKIRGSLIKHGIAVYPCLVSGATVQTGTQTGKGTPIVRYDADFDVWFVNIDAPDDRVSIRVPASALDHGDKAPGKCVSYATKTAELKMFTLETGENDESRIPQEVPTITEDQAADIQALIDEVGGDAKQAMFAWLKIDAIDNIPAKNYKQVITALEKRRAAA